MLRGASNMRGRISGVATQPHKTSHMQSTPTVMARPLILLVRILYVVLRWLRMHLILLLSCQAIKVYIQEDKG